MTGEAVSSSRFQMRTKDPSGARALVMVFCEREAREDKERRSGIESEGDATRWNGKEDERWETRSRDQPSGTPEKKSRDYSS